MVESAVAMFVLAGLCGETAELDAKLTLKPAEARFLLASPMPRKATMLPAQPSSVKRAPAGAGLKWWTLPWSRPDGVVVACDETSATAARLYVDANGNGDLTDDPPAEWKLVDRENPETARHEGGFYLPLPGGATAEKVHLLAYRYRSEAAKKRDLATDLLFYYRDYCATGTVRVNGREHAMLVSDEDTSGQFTYPNRNGAKLCFAIDVNGDGGIGMADEWFEAGQGAPMGGASLLLKEVSPDGGRLELLVAPHGARLIDRFEGPGVDGGAVRFPEDYKGKLVLVEFWATWCGACQAAMPTVVQANRRFRGPTFDTVGISLDSRNAGPQLREYVQKNGMKWRHIFDGKGWGGALVLRHNVKSIPTMLLVDADSMMVMAEGLALRGTQLESTIANCLARKAKWTHRQGK